MLMHYMCNGLVGSYTLIVSAFDAEMQGASLVLLATEASMYLQATQVR